MKVQHLILKFLPGLLAVPLLAQPQIGGGTCSTASLNGKYSVSLSGRALSATVGFTSVSQAVGSVAFDGLSKVTFTLTNNTNKFFGVAETLSGTYTLQSNCVGAISITSGDTASFTLLTYNNGGNNYLITGEDGVYSFTGNGGILPATCASTIPAGSYSFNGNGFGLGSGAVSNAFDISGVIQIGATATNSIAVTSYLATGTGITVVNSTGTFTVTPNCTATASVTDSTGTAYALTLEITSANGENFFVTSSSPLNLIMATGRLL
jgi:hypothetical protein